MSSYPTRSANAVRSFSGLPITRGYSKPVGPNSLMSLKYGRSMSLPTFSSVSGTLTIWYSPPVVEIQPCSYCAGSGLSV